MYAISNDLGLKSIIDTIDDHPLIKFCIDLALHHKYVLISSYARIHNAQNKKFSTKEEMFFLLGIIGHIFRRTQTFRNIELGGHILDPHSHEAQKGCSYIQGVLFGERTCSRIDIYSYLHANKDTRDITMVFGRSDMKSDDNFFIELIMPHRETISMDEMIVRDARSTPIARHLSSHDAQWINQCVIAIHDHYAHTDIATFGTKLKKALSP